jgi:hypothetical protein
MGTSRRSFELYKSISRFCSQACKLVFVKYAYHFRIKSIGGGRTGWFIAFSSKRLTIRFIMLVGTLIAAKCIDKSILSLRAPIFGMVTLILGILWY